jgi:hypothetical protein
MEVSAGGRGRLDRSITRPAADPIEQQEGTDEKWEYSVQGVANGMRMSVNSHKYRYAEQGGEQAHDRTWSGYRHIKPTDTFEPLYFHMFWLLHAYGSFSCGLRQVSRVAGLVLSRNAAGDRD